jgi:hypothetical protein
MMLHLVKSALCVATEMASTREQCVYNALTNIRMFIDIAAEAGATQSAMRLCSVLGHRAGSYFLSGSMFLHPDPCRNPVMLQVQKILEAAGYRVQFDTVNACSPSGQGCMQCVEDNEAIDDDDENGVHCPMTNIVTVQWFDATLAPTAPVNGIDDCSICLQPADPAKAILSRCVGRHNPLQPPEGCKRLFHIACVDEMHGNRCPLCRTPICWEPTSAEFAREWVSRGVDKWRADTGAAAAKRPKLGET